MKRRITVNFKTCDVSYASEDEKKEYLKRNKEHGTVIAYDTRNGIYCIEPSNDMQCYKNYIEYLNENISEWKNFEYLDMGLVPLIYAPSFLQDIFSEQADQLSKIVQCPVFSLRPISLLQNGCVGLAKDVWIKKSDLARVLNVDESQARLTTLLDRVVGGLR